MHKPMLHSLLALLFLLLSGRPPLFAGETGKKSQPNEAALEKQLHDAERQLREAARQLAELRGHDAGLKRLDVEKIQRVAEQAARDAEREVRIVRKIRKGEPRARLGVQVESGDDAKGAVIRAVEPGSPAQEAGLKPGDIITGVNGSPLAGKGDDDDSPAERLARLGREFKPDTAVTIDYQRDGAAHTATVKPRLLPGGERRRVIITRDGDNEREIELPDMADLPEMPDMPEMPELPRFRHKSHHPFMMSRGRMNGLELMNLQGDLGDYFGVHEGLLVLRVAPKSELPLKAGDVILKVDGKAVAEPHDVMRALHHGKAGETIALEIQRKQLRQSLSVKRPDHEKEREMDFDLEIETPEPPEVPEAPHPPRPPKAPKPPRTPT